MDNLLLKRRFIFSKRKFVNRTAEYFPIGITKNENLDMGARVVIKSEPYGGENKVVEVSRITRVNYYHKEIESEDKQITVFLKDLSPVGVFVR